MKNLVALLLALLCVVSFGCKARSNNQQSGRLLSSTLQFGEATKAGVVKASEIDESSGLAASRNFEKHFWTHNDGGSTKGLFLLDSSGKLKATVALPKSVPFRDWEDMASATVDGTNYLFIGDVGDNLSKYKTCRVYVFKEPDGKLSGTVGEVARWSVKDVATIEFKYDNGPRNCESMMVDTFDKRIYFVSKRAILDSQTTLHWLPLQTSSTKAGQSLIAKSSPFAFNRPTLTGMSVSADGNSAVLRSYRTAWLFQRGANQTWADRFQADYDHETALPGQRQGEAIAFSNDGTSVFLTSEGTGQPFWKIPLKQQSDAASVKDEGK